MSEHFGKNVFAVYSRRRGVDQRIDQVFRHSVIIIEVAGFGFGEHPLLVILEVVEGSSADIVHTEYSVVQQSEIDVET